MLTLISLHWLRVAERIYFKLTVMTYRSIHGTSLSYLQSCFTRVSEMTSRRRLRSSISHRLDVSTIRLSTVVSGVWCHSLERSASPRRICAVTRGFQTTTHKTFLFSRSCQNTIISLVCNYHHSSLLSGPPWSLQ